MELVTPQIYSADVLCSPEEIVQERPVLPERMGLFFEVNYNELPSNAAVAS